jgi:hypothetical protein
MRTCLFDVVDALSKATPHDAEVVAVALHLIQSGRMRWPGGRLDPAATRQPRAAWPVPTPSSTLRPGTRR